MMRVILAALALCACVVAQAQTVQVSPGHASPGQVSPGQVPPDVRSACTGDAMKFCPMRVLLAAAAGNVRGIHLCFSRHRRELSQGCDRVLRRHGY
jgi:hypothetical protein